MMEDIKPCPFCGGEGQLVCGEKDLYYIACEDCAAESPTFKEQHKSAKWWNRRATTNSFVQESEKFSRDLYLKLVNLLNKHIDEEKRNRLSVAAEVSALSDVLNVVFSESTAKYHPGEVVEVDDFSAPLVKDISAEELRDKLLEKIQLMISARVLRTNTP